MSKNLQFSYQKRSPGCTFTDLNYHAITTPRHSNLTSLISSISIYLCPLATNIRVQPQWRFHVRSPCKSQGILKQTHEALCGFFPQPRCFDSRRTLHPHPGSFSSFSSLTLDCIVEGGDATTVLRRDMTTRSRSLSDPASRHSTHEGSSCQLPIKPVIRKRKEVWP